jgi:hypothetical protein
MIAMELERQREGLEHKAELEKSEELEHKAELENGEILEQSGELMMDVETRRGELNERFGNVDKNEQIGL